MAHVSKVIRLNVKDVPDYCVWRKVILILKIIAVIKHNKVVYDQC